MPTPNTPLACDMTALSTSQRARYDVLRTQLGKASQEVRELPNGYGLSFAPDLEAYLAISEFVLLERRCCPFLRFNVELEPNCGPLWLRLTGPKGTKPLLREELGVGTPK